MDYFEIALMIFPFSVLLTLALIALVCLFLFRIKSYGQMLTQLENENHTTRQALEEIERKLSSIEVQLLSLETAEAEF